MAIEQELLDKLLKDYKKPDDLLGEEGILKQLTKALVERAMDGELTHHLGYEKNSIAGNNSGNSRNGKYPKTVKGKNGELTIQVPRDRNGNYEPNIIKKGQRRFDGFDDKIISMYSRGLTTREIQGHLEDIYGVDVSPDLISTVTNEVIQEVKDWQNRPLDPVYPIVYLDALVVKVREQNVIINKAVYLAIGVNMDGLKEVLGMWMAKTEGAKFWLQIITEIKNRGVQDILIACVDGLKGFPEAIESLFSKTQIQLCIVHMVRNSLKYVPYKDRKPLAQDLKEIYRAPTSDQAESNLEKFEKKWNGKYPMISKSWRANWDRLIPFFAFPEDIRKVIYTTNAIESLNMSLRKIIKNRGSFPNDDAALKLLYLALRNIKKKWTMPIKDWGAALNQLSIIFDNRIKIY
jgi:putative transposase